MRSRCYRPLYPLRPNEKLEAAAGIAEHIDHIACTQYMDSEATGKEIARCIRATKEEEG